MTSSQLPTVPLLDLPFVTATHLASPVALGEGLPSETFSENRDSGDNEEAPFAEIVYRKRRRQKGPEHWSTVFSADTIVTQLPGSLDLVDVFVPTMPDTRFHSTTLCGYRNLLSHCIAPAF